MQAPIKVEGLKELQRTLGRLSKDAQKEVRAVNKSAAQIVADEAASRAPVRTGRLKRSIRALGQSRGATVKAGGARVPYAGWIEFGGRIPRAVRPFIREGRFLFPALERNRRRIEQMYLRELESVLRKHNRR